MKVIRCFTCGDEYHSPLDREKGESLADFLHREMRRAESAGSVLFELFVTEHTGHHVDTATYINLPGWSAFKSSV